MLSRFADEYFNGRRFVRGSLLDHGLDAVSKQFPNDILEMRWNIGKSGVQVTPEHNFGYGSI
jgi:hypothetical protein